jgi:hypothetical protein
MAGEGAAARINLIMHSRRLACFFLGIWLGGSLLMALVASQNLKQADRALAEAGPAARLELKALGPNARTLFRYQAAEQNRSYLRNWTLAQVVFGALFLLVMLFGSHEGGFVLIGILCMVLLSALERFFLVPETSVLGRMVDFLPADQGVPERNRLWVLQAAYYAVEAGKWILGLALTAAMVFSRRRSGRSRDSRREFDVVNKPNYRGINR